MCIAALLWKADDAFSVKFKEDVALWLLCLDRDAVAKAEVRWPENVTLTFNAIFGEKHWRLRCFLLSALLSVAAVLWIAYLKFWWMVRVHLELFTFISDSPGEFATLSFMYTYLVPVVWIVANTLADYISLWETRVIVMKYGHSRRGPLVSSVELLVVDFLFTTVIIVVVLWPMVWLSQESASSGVGASPLPDPSTALDGLKTTLRMVLGLLPGQPGTLIEWSGSIRNSGLVYLIVGPPLYTTYLTSAWVWVVIGARFLLRLAARIQPLADVFRYMLPVETKPLRSFGIIMGVFATLVYWGYVLVFGTLLAAASI